MTVLRASGPDFDVDAFLAQSTLKPCAVFHRGEPRFPGGELADRRCEQSGMNVVASQADFDFALQVKEATAFLSAHAEEIRQLAAFSGVEGVTLDFSSGQRDVPLQCHNFPPDLIRAAAGLGLGIELSLYAISEAADEDRPR